MFLPHRDIIQKAQRGLLISSEFKPELVKQASYDLRLGEEIFVVGKRAPDRLTERNPYVSLPSGQFAILTCYEEITMPNNMLAFIALKTSFKFQGLVNISGFHVDPTFRGRLLFAVQNVGPNEIRLKYKEPTFSIFFSYLTSNKIGPSRDQQPDVHFQKLTGIRLEHMQSLGGNSVTLSKLQKDLDRLKLLITIYGPFGVAAFIALLVALVKLFTGKG
jgi:dCTP deaminase